MVLPLLKKCIQGEKVDVGSQLSFGSLQPSFINAYFFMLWKRCICQTIIGSVPRRPLFSEIPRCFNASLDLQPIRHKEKWRDYWCNISEFIAGWGASGHRRKVSDNRKVCSSVVQSLSASVAIFLFSFRIDKSVTFQFCISWIIAPLKYIMESWPIQKAWKFAQAKNIWLIKVY